MTNSDAHDGVAAVAEIAAAAGVVAARVPVGDGAEAGAPSDVAGELSGVNLDDVNVLIF